LTCTIWFGGGGGVQVARNPHGLAIQFLVGKVSLGDALLGDLFTHRDQAVDVDAILFQAFDPLTVVGKRIFIDFLSGLEPVSNPRDHTQLENSIFVQLRKRVVELRLGRHQVIPGDLARLGRDGAGVKQQARDQGYDSQVGGVYHF
jgi:hypothetical protein